VFEMSSYYFYKVIEVLVRVEDGLSRDVVKHLNHVSSGTLPARFRWFVVYPYKMKVYFYESLCRKISSCINVYFAVLTVTTTTTVLRPFVQDYPGEPVPEETFSHPPS